MDNRDSTVGLLFTHDGIGRLSEVDWDVAPGGSGTTSLAEYGWVGGLRQKRAVHYSLSASSTHSQVSKFESNVSALYAPYPELRCHR